jgi:hypothetical protein
MITQLTDLKFPGGGGKLIGRVRLVTDRRREPLDPEVDLAHREPGRLDAEIKFDLGQFL